MPTQCLPSGKRKWPLPTRYWKAVSACLTSRRRKISSYDEGMIRTRTLKSVEIETWSLWIDDVEPQWRKYRIRRSSEMELPPELPILEDVHHTDSEGFLPLQFAVLPMSIADVRILCFDRSVYPVKALCYLCSGFSGPRCPHEDGVLDVNSERRRAVARKMFDDAAKRGVALENDPVFAGWVEEWVAGSIDVEEIRRRNDERKEAEKAERRLRRSRMTWPAVRPEGDTLEDVLMGMGRTEEKTES